MQPAERACAASLHPVLYTRVKHHAHQVRRREPASSAAMPTASKPTPAMPAPASSASSASCSSQAAFSEADWWHVGATLSAASAKRRASAGRPARQCATPERYNASRRCPLTLSLASPASAAARVSGALASPAGASAVRDSATLRGDTHTSQEAPVLSQRPSTKQSAPTPTRSADGRPPRRRRSPRLTRQRAPMRKRSLARHRFAVAATQPWAALRLGALVSRLARGYLVERGAWSVVACR